MRPRYFSRSVELCLTTADPASAQIDGPADELNGWPFGLEHTQISHRPFESFLTQKFDKVIFKIFAVKAGLVGII